MTFSGKFAAFCRDERGATAIEYALLAALIGVGILGGAALLGTTLDDTYVAIGDATETAIEPIGDAEF